MKEFRPLVSIIVPCYNSEKYLQECLNSILTQDYENVEVLVVNDGSIDGSEEIAKAFGQQDDRLKYFYQDNNGVGSARNLGLREAKGEYVAFLDSDDAWLPGKLGKQIELLENNPDAVIFGGVRHIYESDPQNYNDVFFENFESKKQFLNYLLYQTDNVTFTGAVIFKREHLSKVGFFIEGISNAEDWDLWTKLACHFPFHAIEEPLYYRRKHDMGLTTIKPIAQRLKNELYVLDLLRAELKVQGISLSKVLSYRFLMYSDSSFYYKKKVEAMLWLVKSLFKYPLIIKEKKFFWQVKKVFTNG